MNAFTETYKLVGLNRAELIKRLKNAGVEVVKLKIINDKVAEITIDGKDSAKYFAICKNMWYNVLLKRGGWLYPLTMLKQNVFKLLCCALLAVAIVLFDGVYLGNVYEGDALLYRAETERAFKAAGIKNFEFFSDEDLSKASAILAAEQKTSFLSIKKRGNKAVVSIKELKDKPELFPSSDEGVFACDDCEIIKIVVYSGTALKNSGDKVLKGEPIVVAYIEEDGTRTPCAAVCAYSAKFKFVYVYEVESGANLEKRDKDAEIADAIICARLALGEKNVLSLTHLQKENEITVYIEYERSFVCDREL